MNNNLYNIREEYQNFILENYGCNEHKQLNSINPSKEFTNNVPFITSKEDEFQEIRKIIIWSFAPRISVSASDEANNVAKLYGYDSFLNLISPFGDNIIGPLSIRNSKGFSTSLNDFNVHFVSNEAKDNKNEINSNNSLLDLMKKTNISDQFSSISINHDIHEYNMKNYLSLESKFYSYLSKNSNTTNDKINDNENDNNELKNDNDNDNDNDNKTNNFNNDPNLSKKNYIHRLSYLHYLRKILSSFPISEHETFSHPILNLIAITPQTKNPIDVINSLSKLNLDFPLSQAVDTDVLQFYVLVYTDNDDYNETVKLFDKIKKSFGLNCHLLKLNANSSTNNNTSVTTINSSPASWPSIDYQFELLDENKSKTFNYQFIDPEDTKSIKALVRNLVLHSLIPHLEQTINTLNDQVASSRRSVTNRFFNASKRYFSSRSSSSSNFSSTNEGYDAVTETYPCKCAEAQLRKLADYAFMTREWNLAFSTYELLKKDFLNDKAWKYHAGSQEMGAIALIISNSTSISQLNSAQYSNFSSTNTNSNLNSSTSAGSLSPSSSQTNNGNNLSNNNNNRFKINEINTKALIEGIDFLIDSAVYSYVSRCSLPAYAFRCILIASELLRLRGDVASTLALKWISRAYEENWCGKRIGSAFLLERISACYGLHGFSKYLNSADLIPSISSYFEISCINDKTKLNKQLLTKEYYKSLSSNDSKRFNKLLRRQAFWMLLAADKWNELSMGNDLTQEEKDGIVYVKELCINLSKQVYGIMKWPTSEGLLLHNIEINY